MKTRYLYLSHMISGKTPLYGGATNIHIRPDLSIARGDVANTLLLEFPNHISTHIDFPRHFSDTGKSINDYRPEFWFFRHVHVLQVSIQAGEILDLEPYVKNMPADTELLLIKSGFQKHRNEKVYWENNPGLSPHSASRVKQKCPALRAIGMDFISVGSVTKPDIGEQAHRAYLLEQDIVLVEDMNLEPVTTSLETVYLFPLLIDGADGGPVTVIGEQTE